MSTYKYNEIFKANVLFYRISDTDISGAVDINGKDFFFCDVGSCFGLQINDEAQERDTQDLCQKIANVIREHYKAK